MDSEEGDKIKENFTIFNTGSSVGDPDPHLFGPPASGSIRVGKNPFILKPSPVGFFGFFWFFLGFLGFLGFFLFFLPRREGF